MKHVKEQLDRVANSPNPNQVDHIYLASDEARTLRAGLEALALAKRLAADIREEVKRLGEIARLLIQYDDATPQMQLYTAWADALEGVVNVAE